MLYRQQIRGLCASKKGENRPGAHGFIDREHTPNSITIILVKTLLTCDLPSSSSLPSGLIEPSDLYRAGLESQTGFEHLAHHLLAVRVGVSHLMSLSHCL